MKPRRWTCLWCGDDLNLGRHDKRKIIVEGKKQKVPLRNHCSTQCNKNNHTFKEMIKRKSMIPDKKLQLYRNQILTMQIQRVPTKRLNKLLMGYSEIRRNKKMNPIGHILLYLVEKKK